MQEIKPTYVTFEQSKYFYSKGLDLICENYWLQTQTEYKRVYIRELYADETPICSAPEQWQVVEWLRVNHGIWISIDMIYEENQIGFWYCIRQSKEGDEAIQSDEYSTPQEAYSAAFDYIKDNNLI
jgi:hypothetical protein